MNGFLFLNNLQFSSINLTFLQYFLFKRNDWDNDRMRFKCIRKNYLYKIIDLQTNKMLLRAVIRSSFGKVKPLKIHGQTEGTGVHFISSYSPNNIQIENPLETLIASLASCELGTLRAISRNSNLQIKNVKFLNVESGIDVEKFMKGGPQDKI